jgi:hypothetical protein
MEKIKRLLKELENEISSEKFIKLYQTIREKHSSIKSYLTPQALIDHLHNQNDPDYILNDEILSSLISEYQSQQTAQSIGSYLLILFKPGLLKIFSQFKRRAKQFTFIQEIDLWCQIVTIFFEVLKEFNLNQDKTKLAAKVLGRLRNRLRDYFINLFKEMGVKKELNQTPTFRVDNFNKYEPQENISSLEDLVKLGIISEIDKYILLATNVYGKSMKDISKQLKDISYSAIRQRKVRAQKAIRAYFGNKKI